MGDTRKRFRPEQNVAMLREAEVELAKGLTIPAVAMKLGITYQTSRRWRREFRGCRRSSPAPRLPSDAPEIHGPALGRAA